VAALARGTLEAPEKGARQTVTLADGELLIGGQPFTRGSLESWQIAAWDRALRVKKRRKESGDESDSSLARAVLYLCSRLGDGEWIAPPALKPALAVFFERAKRPEPDRICDEGWRCGCLARQRQGGQTHYRLPGGEAPSERELAAGLETRAGQSVGVDAGSVHLAALEFLARTASFQVSRGRLHAIPSIKKLGRRWEKLRDAPVANWLREHSAAYQATISAVESRQGRCIVHKNLLIARIRDLSLRVQIEKAIKDSRKLQVLDDELIMLAPAVWRQVEKLVKKSGHVLKVVEPK
jgi:hypothetical protein